MSDALVHAVLIDPSGEVRTLDWEQVQAWRPEQGLLWVHLVATAELTRDWLTAEAGLPKVVSTALVADGTRPRASVIGDGALLVLRGVNLNPGADPEDMVSIRIWADAQRVISTRRRRLLSVGEVLESFAETPLKGSGDLIARLTDRLGDHVTTVIDGVEDRAAEIEQDVLDDPDQEMRTNLAELRREAIALRRYLAPQREALARLQIEPLSWLREQDRLHLHEVSDQLIRHLEALDAVRERAAVIQEELIGHMTDQLNRRMYVLSIFSVMFLPLGFLTGLLGVNLGGIPGAEHPHGFLYFSLGLAALLASLAVYFLRKRWL